MRKYIVKWVIFMKGILIIARKTMNYVKRMYKFYCYILFGMKQYYKFSYFYITPFLNIFFFYVFLLNKIIIKFIILQDICFVTVLDVLNSIISRTGNKHNYFVMLIINVIIIISMLVIKISWY